MKKEAAVKPWWQLKWCHRYERKRERENGKVICIGTIAQLSGGSSNDRVLDFGFKGPELKSHSLRAA